MTDFKRIPVCKPNEHLVGGVCVPFYETREMDFSGTKYVVDVPKNMSREEMMLYGFALEEKNSLIRIRIIPRQNYQKHLLSIDELKKRLKVIIMEQPNLGETVKIENPLDVFERQGRLHRVNDETIKRHYHFLRHHYENPHESEHEDHRLEAFER